MGYYLLVIGSLISAFAAWMIFAHLKLLVTGARTSGVIDGVEQRLRFAGESYKKIYFHPVIEFETNGRTIRFTYGSGSTRRRPAVGDEVTVVYGTTNPENAKLNSFLGIWAGPLALAVLGGGTLYGGVQMVFLGTS